MRGDSPFEVYRGAAHWNARQARVHRELLAGVLTLAQALAEGDVGALRVARVIGWLPGYGPARTGDVLQELMINPTRRCRDLTDRQRALLDERTRPR